MRKTLQIVTSITLITLVTSCAWRDNHKGIKMASEGDTTQVLYYPEVTQPALKTATIKALQERGWKIIQDEPTIKASVTDGIWAQQIIAKLEIKVSPEKLSIDTTGSKHKETAYVPVRFINNLDVSIKNNLGIKK